MPGVAAGGKSGRDAYSVSSIVPRGGEQRANVRSGVSHLHGGGQSNIGNTIGTIRADRRDESTLCAAIPRAAATRSRQNNLAMHALDLAKVSPA